MHAPRKALRPSTLPVRYAWAAAVGAGLFFLGAILNLLAQPQAAHDKQQRVTGGPEMPTLLPTGHLDEQLVDRPVLFQQPRILLEVEISMAWSRLAELQSGLLTSIESRLRGLGECDIQFESPRSVNALGTLLFVDLSGKRWRAPVHVVSGPGRNRGTQRVALLAWMAEPITAAGSSASSDLANFDDLWSRIQREMRLPLIDAASEFSNARLIYPTD